MLDGCSIVSKMDSNKALFNENIAKVLNKIYTDPSILQNDDEPMRIKLRSQGKKDSQGTGNAVTPQEAYFAVLLESNGFTFIPKEKKGNHIKYIKKNNLSDGLYYIYQVNGSQQSIDFGLILLKNKEIIEQINFDLKHSNNDVIFLNDGWFENNVIYLVTWFNKETVKSFIGLGQHIPTKEDKEIMDILLKFKKGKNSETKKGGFLIPYLRFANRYLCSQFTEDFTKENYEKVKQFLTHI